MRGALAQLIERIIRIDEVKGLSPLCSTSVIILSKNMKTILTGIRINSEITLGNFLGAMLPMVRLANKYSKTHHVNVFIPDLHSIISSVDGNLKENTLREIKYYLAAGLEVNQNVHIYRQSYIPAHSELCWILDCQTPMGDAMRMTQYKEKSQNNNTSTNVGIFNYPILMAADILLYDASYIPVGEDQFQHLELTRNIAERFNHKYGETFVVPENTATQIKFMETLNNTFSNQDKTIASGLRIRDLQNPERKMSKSANADNSKIMMSDPPKLAAKKIMSATTDSFAKIQFDMFNQPGISNLLQIEALINNEPLQTTISTWAGVTRYGDFKQKVAGSVSHFLEDFQSKAQNISNETIYGLFEQGEVYANTLASQKLLQVQKVIGLR